VEFPHLIGTNKSTLPAVARLQQQSATIILDAFKSRLNLPASSQESTRQTIFWDASALPQPAGRSLD